MTVNPMNVITKIGRPRDAARESAIIQATLEVLREVGYDRLTIDAVAARAKASKATVYRRWSSKAELVVDAMETLEQPDAPCAFPDTGSLRSDLLGGLRQIAARMTSADAPLFAGVITASARNPELAATLQGSLLADKQESCRQVVDRAIARGELATSFDREIFVEVLPAVLFFRAFTSGKPLDEAFLQHVVDDIAMPLTFQHCTAAPLRKPKK